MTRNIGLIAGTVIIAIFIAFRVVSDVSWRDTGVANPVPNSFAHAAMLRAGVADLQTFSLNVRDCGAMGDGVADDTTALQVASDTIGAAGVGVSAGLRGQACGDDRLSDVSPVGL